MYIYVVVIEGFAEVRVVGDCNYIYIYVYESERTRKAAPLRSATPTVRKSMGTQTPAIMRGTPPYRCSLCPAARYGSILTRRLHRCMWSLVVMAVITLGGKVCKVQRTLLERKGASGKRAQGRPLGYLCAWLQAGCRCTVTDRQSHRRANISRADRIVAREALTLLEGSADLLADERPRADGEPEEPMGQP